jgi:uncharacterized protein (DUF736 family)
MRKRIIKKLPSQVKLEELNWLDLEQLAQVEITSEDPGYPIESALTVDLGPGWRASQPGEQSVRLLFDKPLKIRRIRLTFQEDEQERTQEIALRWLPEGGQLYRETVRQQFNFSPPATAIEIEDYNVDLDRVAVLELKIKPDISGGGALAKLAQLRLA